MIRYHIDSIQECGVVLKLGMFSQLSDRSFELGSLIGLDVLSRSLSSFNLLGSVCLQFFKTVFCSEKQEKHKKYF